MSSFAVMAVIVSLSLLLAQKYISREYVKKEILDYLSARIGGTFEFEAMDFQFFHRPRVAIRGGSFSIPGEAEGTFDTLIVYPKVLPLLTGHVDISYIEIEKPVIRLTIPKETEPETVEEKRNTIALIKDYISSALGYFNEGDRGMEAVIKNGRLVLVQTGYEDMAFDGLNVSAGLPDDRLEIRVTGRGSLWNRLSLSASASTSAKDINGNLTLEGFRPHLLSRYFPEALQIIKDSNVNLAVDFSIEKLDSLRLKVNASIPGLTLTRNEEDFTARLKSLNAEARFADGKSSVVLNRMELTNPPAVIAGSYEMEKSSASGKLHLEGENIDAGAAREATLIAAGGNDIVDKIFEVVRGGTVPKVTLEVAGPTFREFWRKGNFTLKGNMVNGMIHIPVIEYDIEDASGDALIGDDMLNGTNLSGRFGSSIGYDGTLVLGFDGDDAPLNLDIAVDAEPSQIPPVISRFVDDETVKHELSLLSNIKGKVTGRLKLGEKKNDLEPVIDATGIDFTANYGRFPYPLHVKGGTYSFAEKVMTLKGISVSGGNSSLSDVSGVIELEDKDRLDIKIGAASIDLGQIYSWLGEFEGFGPHLKNVGSVTGMADFPSVSIKGPISIVKNWTITAEGRVTGVNIDLSGTRDRLTIAGADITSSGGRIELSNAVLSHGETSVNLDMVLSDYFARLFSLKMDFNGTVDPSGMTILTNYVPLPEELVFSGPLSVGDSSLELKGGGGKKPGQNGKPWSGQASDGGPEWDVDVNVHADALEWRETEPASEEPANAAHTEGEEWKSPVSGNVKIESASFKFKKLNWDSVHAMVSFMENGVDIDVSKADLCGISTPGVVNVVPPGVKFEFRPNTNDESLEVVIKCLLDKAGIITGDLNLNAVLTSNGGEGNIFNMLHGNIELSSTDGWVEKYGSLARFFAMLNFGDLFRGRGPDFGKEGFRYDKLTARADVGEGKVNITEAVMEGPSMKVVAEGFIDLVNNKIDIEFVVIPVMAVDSVIEKIPLINFLLGGSAVSIPIKVTGDLSNPTVSPMSPSAIRFGLLGLVKQTLNIPATILKPMNKAEKGHEDSSGTPPPPTPPANGASEAMPGLPNK
jgi:hypothetical protein